MQKSPITEESHISKFTPPDSLKKEYAEIKEKYKKTTMCYYFWRQRCLFSKERCKFAHGVRDLKRYQHNEFVEIREKFFRLKAETHGGSNPHGIDPNPKESKIDELVYSSDEEDSQIFKQKRKSRSKAEHDKLKEWQHHLLSEFALFLFEEQQTKYMRKSFMEKLFDDVKLKFEARLFVEKMNILYPKAVILAPSINKHTSILIQFPSFDDTINLLAEYIGQIAIQISKNHTFPIIYKRFEKLYHDNLPLLLPEIPTLCDILKTPNEQSFIKFIENNPKILNTISANIGPDSMKHGFVTCEDCTPLEKLNLQEKLSKTLVISYESAEKLCNEICAGTLQYFSTKDRQIRAILWSVGYKFIQTNAGCYLVKNSEDYKSFDEIKINWIDENCACRKNTDKIIAEKSQEKIMYEIENFIDNEIIDLRDQISEINLIDSKILWVCDFLSFKHAILLMRGHKEFAIDLEGALSVFFFLTIKKVRRN